MSAFPGCCFWSVLDTCYQLIKMTMPSGLVSAVEKYRLLNGLPNVLACFSQHTHQGIYGELGGLLVKDIRNA